MKYVIDGDTMTGIADAVREKTGDTDTMTPSVIEEKIRGLTLGGAGDSMGDSTEWERPEAWPDLDAAYERTEKAYGQFLYLTYDNSDKSRDRFISLTVEFYVGKGDISLEVGTVTDGSFTSSESKSSSKGSLSYSRLLTDEDPDFPVVRLVYNQDIYKITMNAYTLDGYGFTDGMLQPCVEMAGHLPSLTAVPPKTHQLERCRLSGGAQLTSLASTWAYCYNLRSLDLSEWDISNVTKMTDVWAYCPNLQTLTPPKDIKVSLGVPGSNLLSKTSLLTLLENLQAVSSSQTLTLGSVNLAKLTSAEQAIATDKGWTLE